MMTKKQILQARTLFSDYPDEETPEKRHRDFGCLPRFLFEPEEEDRNAQIARQDKALASLTAKEVRDIVFNLTELNSNNNAHAPPSSIMWHFCTKRV
jgi:hypothetical protein